MKKINFGIALILFGFNCLYVSITFGPVFIFAGIIFSLIGISLSFSGFIE